MTPNPTNDDGAMNGVLQTSAVLTELASAAIAHTSVEGHHYLVLPEGYRHHDITDLVAKTRPAPARKSGSTQVHDIASLLQLCADRALEFADAQGYIYADIDARTIVAVWNDQRQATAPGWRDHRAVFQAVHTPEFKRWVENDRRDMGQEAFAEFIEDNAADLPEAAMLLEVAGTLQARTDVQFRSARRLDNGQVQLGYVETIEARAGAEGALTIPKEFTLGLRIFKNGAGYRLRARLKYRLAGGSVKLRYELDRPERAVEDAFAGYVAQVREGAPSYVVLLGKA